MRFLYKLDLLIGKQIVWFTLGCAALAVAFPTVFYPMTTLTPALFAFMTFSSSLGAGFRELGRVMLRPLPLVVMLLLLHLVLPVLALGAGRLLFPENPYFTTGLVLEFAVPTAVASLMWVSMYRGNGTLSLSVVLLDTLLSPLLIPLTLKFLIGSAVSMDTVGMMRDLILMVALPAFSAMLFFQIGGAERSVALKARLSPFAKLCLLCVLLANCTGVASFLRSMNSTLWRVTGTVFLLCVVGFFLGYSAARLLRLDFPSSLSMTLNTGMRNINAGAVLAAAYFPAETLFPVVISSLFLQFLTSVVVQLLQRTKAGRAHQANFERDLPE